MNSLVLGAIIASCIGTGMKQRRGGSSASIRASAVALNASARRE